MHLGRIEFNIVLFMDWSFASGCSPSASRRRSYLQLRTGQCSRPERTFTLLLVRTFRRTYPGTSCLATISLSLRDNATQPQPQSSKAIRPSKRHTIILAAYEGKPWAG